MRGVGTEVDTTMERIRRAALGRFARFGYGSTTMEDIATAAGVGGATLYRRWPDKPSLADSLLADVLSEFEALIAPGEGSSPKRRFVALVDRLWRFATDDPDRFVFLEGSVHAPYISAPTAARKESLTTAGGALLRDAGVRADQALASAMVMGTMIALLGACADVDPVDLAERLWAALRC